MAKEEIKEKPIEEVKAETVTAHKVKKEFTLDKLYRKGDPIYLTEGKIKETLISNKFI